MTTTELKRAKFNLEVLHERAWSPVFCRGKRKSGDNCLNIVGYKKDRDYIAKSFLTLCHRCKHENVVS